MTRSPPKGGRSSNGEVSELEAVLREELRTALGTDYVLGRELSGGMSRVYLARDERLGRDVVVKALNPEIAERLSAERFTREIRLAAALQEPHIVPVLGAGETAGGLPYYTMPFVRDGQRLDQLRPSLPARMSAR